MPKRETNRVVRVSFTRQGSRWVTWCLFGHDHQWYIDRISSKYPGSTDHVVEVEPIGKPKAAKKPTKKKRSRK